MNALVVNPNECKNKLKTNVKRNTFIKLFYNSDHWCTNSLFFCTKVKEVSSPNKMTHQYGLFLSLFIKGNQEFFSSSYSWRTIVNSWIETNKTRIQWTALLHKWNICRQSDRKACIHTIFVFPLTHNPSLLVFSNV